MALALRASAAGCFAYQRPILRLLSSPYAPAINVGVSRRLSLPARPTLLQSQAALISRARYYSTEKPSNETNSEVVPEEASKAALETTQKNDDGEEPWYLQEEPPRHPALVSEAQPLPKVPKGAPIIMHDLVKFVAEDMGLDNLNLLDLRTLDPPAALGPSLIMLFGTARSERHLHISGGRLKSWLRKKGIQADADGLLGPNQLKIKLRRKQRKAKLMGTAAMPLGGDDGISTRWICMNLGTIRSDTQAAIEYETSTGFGIQQTGTTVVVQILTESKRKELDLETLWSRILARRGDDTLVEDDLEYVEVDADPNELSMFSEGGSNKVLAAPSQRRFFSTSLRRNTQVFDPPTSDSATNHVNTYLDAPTFLTTNVAKLEQLQEQFARFSHGDALEALQYSDDGSHSAFIEAWNNAVQHLPPEKSWQFRLWLCVIGRRNGVRRFDLAHLRALVREMELLVIMCHRDDYLEMIQVVYLEPAGSQVSLKEQSDLVLEILNVMYERGEPIMTTEVIVALIESLTLTGAPGGETAGVRAVLDKFILQADLPYMGEHAVMRLMSVYAVQDNWDRFWEVWGMAPRFLLPRSKEMYVHLWTLLAQTNHQRRCQGAIRRCFHEMFSENPPVNPVMEVKMALEACLRVADPSSEQLSQVSISRGKMKRASKYEFVRLWGILNPGLVKEWA